MVHVPCYNIHDYMKKHITRNTKTSTLTVTLLHKIEIMKRIVAVITVVPKETSVPFGFICWQSSLPSSEQFITGNSLGSALWKSKSLLSNWLSSNKCHTRWNTHCSQKAHTKKSRWFVHFDISDMIVKINSRATAYINPHKRSTCCNPLLRKRINVTTHVNLISTFLTNVTLTLTSKHAREYTKMLLSYRPWTNSFYVHSPIPKCIWS